MNTRTLRHLIREYAIAYTLPGQGDNPSASSSNAPGRARIMTALKVLLGVTLATEGLVFFNTQKDAIFAFGSINKAVGAAAGARSVPESVEHRVITRLLSEAEESYKTAYGEITSSTISALLKSNVDKIIAKKDYLQISAVPDASIASSFSAILTALGTVLRTLDAAVTSLDKTGFPAAFSTMGVTPDAIPTTPPTDIDATELAIAEKAMTDACAVAYYNSIHDQVERYLGTLAELVESDSSMTAEVKGTFKAHAKAVLEVYDTKITSGGEKILTGTPTSSS